MIMYASLDSSIIIIVPTTTNISVPADTHYYVYKARDDFTLWFGGATCHGPYGGSCIIQKEVVLEDVYEVKSFCSTKSLEEHIGDVVALAKYICVELKQDSVAIIVNGKMYFITPE